MKNPLQVHGMTSAGASPRISAVTCAFSLLCGFPGSPLPAPPRPRPALLLSGHFFWLALRLLLLLPGACGSGGLQSAVMGPSYPKCEVTSQKGAQAGVSWSKESGTPSKH